MIPESIGATPFGIFLLADQYLRAAKLAAADYRHGSTGPTRLLAYHATELFLKTYMRSAGDTIVALRAHGHDIASMMDRAAELQLVMPSAITALGKKIQESNDYVRVRYVVSHYTSEIPGDSAINLAQTIRECVRQALKMDENGNPTAEHWLAGLPSDYPKTQ